MVGNMHNMGTKLQNDINTYKPNGVRDFFKKSFQNMSRDSWKNEAKDAFNDSKSTISTRSTSNRF